VIVSSRLERIRGIIWGFDGGRSHTFGRVCDGYTVKVSHGRVSVPAIDSQISTAPAVAPARIERIALACRKLELYDQLICLIYTFFFSVVVVAISSRCPGTGVCCSLESCVLELRAGADDYDYDVQILEDPIAAAPVQKTTRKEKLQSEIAMRNLYRDRMTGVTKPIAASNILAAVAGRNGAKH
jgi:hypothetical protein